MNNAKRKTIIVGGVAGGASCAARLRRLDGDREIVLLERGAYISYANCGLPYHVGDVIRNRDALLLMTPELMRARFEIDVRTRHEAVAIDRASKTLRVRRLEDGGEYEETYDDLVIATGSSPLRPGIPGIESPRIRTLWTVPDADALRALIREEKVASAAVIGGGFIGLEMAENLRRAGLEVTIVEAADQVMAPLDFEMAQLLHSHIREQGVALRLSDGVAAFAEDGAGVRVRLNSGAEVRADLVILAIGVRPNSALAGEAGLELGRRGGIVVDAHMRTADPAIYAVGDAVEVRDLPFGEPAMVPLAGPANKQGRIAADNLAGLDSAYAGTQGSSVAKVFELTAAATGASEKALIRRGMARGADYESVIITQNAHAGYYPGATPMTLKLLFSMDGKRIFGAQIVGMEGVDKRIDVLATALRLGAGVAQLEALELAYAPPYSSAKDPVNMAGFTAGNLLAGLVRFAPWDVLETREAALALDVREPEEVAAYAIPGAVNIPLGSLRARVGELDPGREIVVFCAVGVRAYNAARILAQRGFERVQVYPGGARFYRATHARAQAGTPGPKAPPRPDAAEADERVKRARLDCSGMQCPGPMMAVFKAMQDLRAGELLEITASDPGFAADIDSWCRRTGNALVSNECRNGEYVATVRRGEAATPTGSPAPQAGPKGKTIIVFDGDMDKVLAAFVIANGALAMGRPVTMFFTFWGLTALRKAGGAPVKKRFVERVFGAMLPRGAGRLKLSRMNMGGMGSAMMKRIMREKNVDSLEEMMRKAMAGGAKLIACSMSMDVMGIREEELIDGVEIGGVGTYLGDAEESDVNLFI